MQPSNDETSLAKLLATTQKIIRLPEKIQPMLAGFVKEPFDKENWLFEIKFDGYRTVAVVHGEANLFSRNSLSFDRYFPSVKESLKAIDKSAVLDGEIVILDRHGKSDFKALQNFLKTGQGYPVYFVFDILFYDFHDLSRLPLLERKRILKEILPDLPDVKFVDFIKGQGRLFFDKVVALGIEGVIAKDSASIYELGRRSDHWLKIKRFLSQEAVIGGYTEPRKGRKHLGALVLGVYEKQELIYIGHSGGGFTQNELLDLKTRLSKLEVPVSPFKIEPKTNAVVHWARPELVCEMKFTEWTEDGMMRHPIFVGLREDKNPEEVFRERPKPLEKVIRLKADSSKTEFSNLEKLIWPKDGYTKKDLIDYYDKIAERILPYLKDRPEVLNRFPHGIEGNSFYQKNVIDPPQGAETFPVFSESDGKVVNYLLCQNKQTLLYMANLGCIELNPWNSRIQHLERPDYMIMDLDPVEIAFKEVIKTALATKEIFNKLGIKFFCKTSGATGLHICVPLNAGYHYDQAREFAHLINVLVHRKLNKTTSLERLPEKRQGKVYLDYLQNRKGQTLACVYSLRPQPGAPVSTPLEWEEVNSSLRPSRYNISNIFKRLKKRGDLWQEVLGKGIDMQACMDKLAWLLGKDI